MNNKIAKYTFRLSTIGLLLGALAAFPTSAEAGHEHEENGAKAPSRAKLIMPIMNPARGRKLFVSKGCVACHAINGVGGHDAPPMDAHTEMTGVNPFDFAAKMWNHAPGMLAAQEQAFGEPVTFLGYELADIIAFVHDHDAQHDFSDKDLTAKAIEMMKHEHGEPGGGPKEHAKEIGHDEDAPGTPPHKDAPGAPPHGH